MNCNCVTLLCLRAFIYIIAVYFCYNVIMYIAAMNQFSQVQVTGVHSIRVFPLCALKEERMDSLIDI